MMKKKKQSRSQSSTREPSPDSSPSPRLLSMFRSKLVSGKDLKHMFRGMRTKTAPGLSSQSRIVRCPKCHKLLQEPIDATIYKCSGCNSILQAKRWELESNGDSISESLLYSQNRSLSTQLESGAGGSETPMRTSYRKYSSRASPSVDRGYHSETVYKHETSDSRRELMKRADEFRVNGGDSDAFASGRSSPYNSRSNASEWTQHVPFYPASPSPSSAYEYGYSSPFHGSQASSSEQSYYHHQPEQFKQKDREGWFQEASAASPIRETSDGRYYHSSSQSQHHDHRYHNLYEPSSSVYSERSYQANKAPLRSKYSEHSKSGTSSEKRSQRDKKKNVRKKNHVVKRYVLPAAGGAPFATCSYCLQLLQLPQVSLHRKHKGYQVRCGSCSGVLKFSVREKVDSHLDSHSLAEETVTNHQDSASKGHEEIYSEDSHLSISDNGSGDRICKRNDDVILRRNMEMFEDKGSKEDKRSISNTFLDSKSEGLQPSVNHKLREQQPASSESIGETSRNHLEQSEEACSEKSTEMGNNLSERVSCDKEEAGVYEKNELLKQEDMFGDGSGESLDVPVYKNERMCDLSIEAETVADTPVSNCGEPNEYICETRELSEKTGDTQEFDWEETQENEECGGGCNCEDIMGDKPELVLEKSQCIADSICDSSSSNGQIYEDTKHTSDAPQNENQRFIEHPDQSGETKVTTSRIHEEQSKYELDKTNQALDNDKVSEDGSIVFTTKANETLNTSIEGETGEERSVSHQMDPPNENVEDIYEILEYAGERTWTETLEDRAGLNLEEYESNYGNYSKPFDWTSGASTSNMHEYEVGTITEPEEDADGRLDSSSRDSFSDHESAEESAVFEESQDVKTDQSQHEYELPSEKQELSNAVADTVRHEIQEYRCESNETFEYEIPSKRQELSNNVFDTVTPSEPAKMVGDGSAVSLEKASETNISETGEERSVSHKMVPQNENLEAMGDRAELQLEEYNNNQHEWTSERAPTFRLHEYELEKMPASEGDANRRSYSSTDFINDHESSEEKAVAHENKTEELKVTPMVEDGQSFHLENCRNETTSEWTERAPTFPLHDSESGTRLEPDEDAAGRSESSSTGSFSNHESSKLRAVLHKEEPPLMSANRTEKLQLQAMTQDMVSLNLEKGENESTKLTESFDWTSERALTFRLHESELETRLQPNEHADGRSESSSRGSLNDHVTSEEREINHEEDPRLVTDSRTKAQQVGELAKDESMKLDETFEWTSERSLTFRRREYEPRTIPEPDEDESESSFLRGSFNDHGVSKEPRGDVFRLSLDDTLEQERITFHLEKSQGKKVNLRKTFNQQGDTEENIPASKGNESASKMAEVDSEAEEDILGDHLDHLKKENEKSGLTSEPYSHFYNTTDPSEIVGLRLALYETQTSPLRSPLSSPMHTPIGSPLHILMRSPMVSPMNSHIVSPMRSPINSSGSLSDVLFFGNKA